jgi:hypothetical protein
MTFFLRWGKKFKKSVTSVTRLIINEKWVTKSVTNGYSINYIGYFLYLKMLLFIL